MFVVVLFLGCSEDNAIEVSELSLYAEFNDEGTTEFLNQKGLLFDDVENKFGEPFVDEVVDGGREAFFVVSDDEIVRAEIGSIVSVTVKYDVKGVVLSWQPSWHGGFVIK